MGERFNGNDPIVVNTSSLDYSGRMHATAALERQIEWYRQMSGEQRLRVALELHQLACDIAREGIRRCNPGADVDEIERLLRYRLELARG